MTKGLVTVFGGSGFLGKYVVRELVKQGWRVRVPMRRPHTGHELRVIGNVGQVQLIQANLRFPKSVERAVAGSDAVINLAAILYEEGRQKFEALHVRGAENVAKAAQAAGITNFVQMSSIGADQSSESEYARSRAEGEAAVRTHIPTASITRSSLLFGAEDSFFNRFAAMTSFAPALPLIGGGETRFQPVYVGDVAAAIAKIVQAGSDGTTYELGGPRVYTFKELMQFTLDCVARKRFLAPMPIFAARFLGFCGEMSGYLPFIKPFLTRDQVTAFKTDNIVADDAIGFDSMDIKLETIESIVPPYLERYRKYGQFHETRA